MNLDVRRADFMNITRRVFQSVQEIGFKPVERFDAQRHVLLLGMLRRLLKAFDGPLPLVRGAPETMTLSTVTA